MKITLFSTITSGDKSTVVEKLIKYSTPSQEFYLMTILAIIMATIGILLGSIAIVIGSMLISPMLYAFLSLSLGLSISDTKLIRRSIVSILKAAVIGLGASAIVTIFMGANTDTSMIYGMANPALAHGTVGFIAGFAAAYALTKPKLRESLAGIAIAVAVIPPLAIGGIGIASLNLDLFKNGLILFVLNTFTIIGGSLIVFLLMNTYAKKNLAKETLKKEEKKVAKEKE